MAGYHSPAKGHAGWSLTDQSTQATRANPSASSWRGSMHSGQVSPVTTDKWWKAVTYAANNLQLSQCCQSFNLIFPVDHGKNYEQTSLTSTERSSSRWSTIIPDTLWSDSIEPDLTASVLAEYGRPTSITTDFVLQYVSEKVKIKCKQSGITLTFSSPYHHQANSLAEREIGNCKSSLTKAMESEECPFTALWMFRTTPLDRQLPSPYELLFGRKPSRWHPPRRKSTASSKASRILQSRGYVTKGS